MVGAHKCGERLFIGVAMEQRAHHNHNCEEAVVRLNASHRQTSKSDNQMRSVGIATGLSVAFSKN